jgi:hypothetical protein
MNKNGRILLNAILSAMREVAVDAWSNAGSNDSLYKVVARDVVLNKRVILHKGLEQECQSIVKTMKSSIRYNELYYTEI